MVKLPKNRPMADAAAARDGSTDAHAHRFLDRMLEMLEVRGLSAAELRVLLALHEREKTIAGLAEELGQRPRSTWRAGRALSARGLARWRHGGRRRHATVRLTPSGLAAMRPLLTAAGDVPRQGSGSALGPKIPP